MNSPGLKKAIERAQKQITEYNHKDSEQVKAIQTYKTQFNQACAEFGIEVRRWTNLSILFCPNFVVYKEFISWNIIAWWLLWVAYLHFL